MAGTECGKASSCRAVWTVPDLQAAQGGRRAGCLRRSGRRVQDLDSRLRSWGFVLREKPRQHFKQETRLLFGESLWTGVWRMGYWEALQGDQGAVEVTQVGAAGRAGRWEEGCSGGSICRPGDWLSCEEDPRASGWVSGEVVAPSLNWKDHRALALKILTWR